MQDRAGSAQVAVLSIAPWEEYVSALQPNFPMDEDRALKEAIPNTLSIDRQISDALAFGLKLALPTTSATSTNERSSTTTRTSETADDTTTSTVKSVSAEANTSKETSQPGDVSQVQQPEVPKPGAAPRPTASVLDTAVVIDPFVRYSAATALFQEVRVLQRHIRDALIASGQRAYVVRCQVTLMPAQRHQPLDAYTTLSFFATRQTPLTTITKEGPSLRTYELSQSSNANVRIVPLLVSDNLEGAIESASTSVLRRLAFGLLGMIGNAGISADVSRAVDRLQTMVGRELNSLMTVGQISDNTIRVRFGAMNQPDSEVAMVSRNQKVTLLVVMPAETDSKAVRIAAKTDFFNGEDGTQLTPPQLHDVQQRIDLALKNYGIDVDESDQSVADMVATVQGADVEGFKSALRLLKDDRTHTQISAAQQLRLVTMFDVLWVDVAAILSTLPYSVTTVQLPAAWTVEVPQQRPLAVDDGKKLSIVVAGVASLRGSDLYATLPIAANAGELAASSLAIDGRGHATVVFPSPSGTGLCLDKPPATLTPGTLVCAPSTLRFCRTPLRWETSPPPAAPVPPVGSALVTPTVGHPGCWDIAVQYRVASEVKPTPPTPYTIDVGARVIMAAGGLGSVILRVGKAADAAADAKTLVKVSGGDVTSAKAVDDAGKAVPILPKGGGFELASAAVVTFDLKNLHVTVPVGISATNAEKPDRIEVRVDATPACCSPAPKGGS